MFPQFHGGSREKSSKPIKYRGKMLKTEKIDFLHIEVSKRMAHPIP